MKLLALSGKKQSGKDTVATFLQTNTHVLFGDRYLDPYPQVERFYFGTPMKEFCRDYLGVGVRNLWGTDADKNEPSPFRWGDLPHWTSVCEHQAAERLTYRQLLQQVGENMFLAMCPRIWIDRFVKAIYESTADMGISPDPRKPEQIQTIHDLGGKVIRLLRDPYAGSDLHISETALDPDRYDQSNFDAIIDNRELTIAETNIAVYKTLLSWGWVSDVYVNSIQWEAE